MNMFLNYVVIPLILLAVLMLAFMFHSFKGMFFFSVLTIIIMFLVGVSFEKSKKGENQ